ncbi:MAG: SHOCT domain-containing protein [Thermoplasmatales archaeon]|nr:MAG: SHOCT domain-containing protein [Thermoplasmatales archaeon]
MVKKLLTAFLSGFPFIVLNGNGWHMMEWGPHMMDWWGIPFIGFWWIAVWIVQFVLALLVYKDAEKQEKNGLLWFLLVILPWIGILFLIGYLVVRSEETDVKEATENAEKILDERYAKGEINRGEYLQMKKDIEKWR